jgi:Uri superfamily endonuclease
MIHIDFSTAPILTMKGATLKENPLPRTYQLRISVERTVDITIGKLGTFRFPTGEYTYTGSGGTNIKARVARHLASSKKFRWHIDYLLASPEVRVKEFRLFEETECTVNQTTGGVILVPGFGATDCRNGCRSHLRYRGFPKPY